MTAKVKVNMRLGGKTHYITVDMDGNGEFECKIENDCVNFKEFSEGLEKVTMTDLTGKAKSGIVDRYCNCRMSANRARSGWPRWRPCWNRSSHHRYFSP